MALTETYTLANGVQIPVIGFGTWQSADGDVAYDAVKWASFQSFVVTNSSSRAIPESLIARPTEASLP